MPEAARPAQKYRILATTFIPGQAPGLTKMQDYSIGELDSLILKAYRGAGFSWGLAQEAGNAAAWMAMHGLAAIDEFALLLPRIDRQITSELTPLINNGPSWSGACGLLCPVISGLAFSECDLQKLDLNSHLVLHGVQQPLILLPFIAHAASLLETDLEMHTAGNIIVCGKQGQGIDIIAMPEDQGMTKALTSDVEIHQSNKRLVAELTVVHQRATGSALHVATLMQLAQRTYVPATDASRGGAGAGLLDND